MDEKIKKSFSDIMITLGTDKEKKFAWCLRKIDGKRMIFLHERKNGYSCFNEQDYITCYPVDELLDSLPLIH